MPINSSIEIKYLFNPLIPVPLAGRLENVPLPRIFNHLKKNFQNGIISVSRKDGEKKIISFESGAPKFVISNIVEECLGKRFVSVGKMTEEQCEQSVQMMRKHKKKQGEILIQMGLFEPYEIDEALKEQAKERLLDLFSWTEAEYSFSTKKKLRTDLVPLDINLPRIVLLGVRRSYDLSFLRRFLDPFLDCSPFIDGDVPFGIEEFKLATWESKLANLMNGKVSLRDILNRKVTREIDVYHLAFSLGVLEVLKFYDTETTKERLRKQEQETLEEKRSLRKKQERRNQEIIELTKDFVIGDIRKKEKKGLSVYFIAAAIALILILITGKVVFFPGDKIDISIYADPLIVKSASMEDDVLVMICAAKWNPNLEKKATRKLLDDIAARAMAKGIKKIRLKSASGKIIGHALSRDMKKYIIETY